MKRLTRLAQHNQQPIFPRVEKGQRRVDRYGDYYTIRRIHRDGWIEIKYDGQHELMIATGFDVFQDRVSDA